MYFEYTVDGQRVQGCKRCFLKAFAANLVDMAATEREDVIVYVQDGIKDGLDVQYREGRRHEIFALHMRQFLNGMLTVDEFTSKYFRYQDYGRQAYQRCRSAAIRNTLSFR